MSSHKKNLTENQRNELLTVLEERFENNKNRHKEIKWTDVQKRLLEQPDKLLTLCEMEHTGGEPDVVERTNEGHFVFFDCSKESPKGRRSLCYDEEALIARKEHKPKDSAVSMAKAMGIELLSEAEYRKLQQLDEFDVKTSSWLKTPDKIRKLGGAIFGDRRFDTVFIYHNGVQSYYGARGFRGSLII